jgi:hypothetical protein
MKRYTRMIMMNPGESERYGESRRKRYDNGRYAPQSRYDDDEYEVREEYMPRSKRIGFERDVEDRYRMEDEYRMENHYGGEEHEQKMGHGGSYEEAEMDHETAKEWVSSLHNEDGTRGAHWSFERCKQLMEQNNIKCNPHVFWAVMNAVYSDYYAVFRKHGISGTDLYVDLALAWIKDKDAVPDKAEAYFECIVKH